VNAEEIIYKKPLWVSAALILLGCVMIFVAVRKTGSLWSEYFALRSTAASFEDFPVDELPNHVQPTFEEQDINTVLFKTISESARNNKLTVRNISTPVSFQMADIALLTGEVVLEGDFVNVIKCLDHMREQLKWIKISSLKFERDMSPKSEGLYTKAYFQMIKKNEGDSNH
jgi:hypothetical protein